jgi:formate dehydrogenase iron-sulfur subunit
MTTRIYVPQDSGAVSVGADGVARALQLAIDQSTENIQLIRNGSRGLYWLEPLVEIETERGRIAYGPVSETDIPSLINSGILSGKDDHKLCLGPTEAIPYLKNQRRITFARAGIGDPLCLQSYRALEGFSGLKKALSLTPQAIVDTIKNSGLRGRGGAAFPCGIKWQTVLDANAEQKYITCNADEGDSGTFADRLLMEADPYALIEGMTIAGLAVGATVGFIYLRSEYPQAAKLLTNAIANAIASDYLGDDILDSGHCFNLHLRIGAGAYICGEETAMLESLEGKRGMVRAKPPLPALQGLFGQPTVVNNVLSLATVPAIVANGAEAYGALGSGRSQGTLAIQLTGNIKQGGLIEVPFGMPLEKLLDDYGQGCLSGRPIRAVQVGGPLGAYLAKAHWQTPMEYEAFSAIGAMIGHGGVVVFDDGVDMSAQARFAMQFCAEESCGKCTPCRIGSVRGVEILDRIRNSENSLSGKVQHEQDLILLTDLCDTMEAASLCAMGGMTPYPVRSALNYFPEDFSPKGEDNLPC